MGDWTNATPTSTTAGILRPEQLAQRTTLERYAAGPALQRWVENYWVLGWDLPPGTTHTSQVLPHPACTLSVEWGNPRSETRGQPVVLTGVVTRRFDVALAGRAWVLGVKFRPGGLASLTGQSARPWRNAVLPARAAVPDSVVDRLEQVGPDRAAEECVALVEGALTSFVDPEHRADERYDRLLTVLDGMLTDRSIVQVAQLEDRHDISSRGLQRLFHHYIGVGPKWVLARYRLHDAVSALDGGWTGSLTDLAHAHGWYDQAHFIRDFTALVGVPPSHYRSRR